MSKRKSVISAAVGTTFAVTLGVATMASAAENPFNIQPLEKGYMIAYNDNKADQHKSGEGKCGASMADANKDGKVSKEEWDKHSDTMFKKMDTNADGVIDKDEMDKMKEEADSSSKCNS
ncbi:MAG: hypothetical protein H0V39_05130 [Nitrosomonas sp.]|nr:hypothetical protein [Nitrosomonas sp.]